MKSQHKTFNKNMNSSELFSAVFNSERLSDSDISSHEVASVGSVDMFLFESPFRFVPMGAFLLIGYALISDISHSAQSALSIVDKIGPETLPGAMILILSVLVAILFSQLPQTLSDTFSLSYSEMKGNPKSVGFLKQTVLFIFTFSFAIGSFFVAIGSLFLLATTVLPFAIEKSTLVATLISAYL